MLTISANEKIRILEKSRNRLSKELTTIDDRYQESEKFLKELVLVLASLAHDPEESVINALLKELKAEIKSETDTSRINVLTKKIKATIFAFGKTERPLAAKPAQKDSADSAAMVLEVLGEIILGLKTIGDDELKKEINALYNEIHEGFSVESIHAYLDRITVIVQGFKERLYKKKKLDDERQLRIKDQFDAMKKQMSLAQNEAKSTKKSWKEILRASHHDELTGILNRRGYTREFGKQWNIFKRYGTNFSCVFFDIDDFKTINDTYGHRAGDRVLQELARTTLKSFRNVDIPVRYGGDEFMVVLPNTDLNQAMKSAERMRKMVTNTNFRYKGKRVEITISTGVARVGESDTLDTFLERIDQALYLSKSLGKNQVQAERTLDSGTKGI